MITLALTFSASYSTSAQALISAADIPISKKTSFKSGDLYRIRDNKIVEHWDMIEGAQILRSIDLTKSMSQNIVVMYACKLYYRKYVEDLAIFLNIAD